MTLRSPAVAMLWENWRLTQMEGLQRLAQGLIVAGAILVGLTAFGVSGTFDLLAGGGTRWYLEAGPWVGALHTSVRSPTPVDPGDFPFVALALGSRVQIPLGQTVFASLHGQGIVNVVRRGLFVKGQEEPVFRAPALGSMLAAGLGLSFF